MKRFFASYDGVTANGKRKADCWSDKNDKKPREVALNCTKKFWFCCDVCPHEFESALHNVNGGSWCPYCAGQKLCDIEDCTHCVKSSFASYNGVTANGKRKVDCWSDKNHKKPRDVALNCDTKFRFECDKCLHKFPSALSEVSRGTWCPRCDESHGEAKIRLCLQRCGYADRSQTKLEGCRDLRPLPFDNAILTDKLLLRILIEFDGIQHFEAIAFFGGYKGYRSRVRHDILKNKYCLENGCVLLRIAHTDVNMIDSLMEKAIRQSQQNTPGIIFSNPRLYKTFWLSHPLKCNTK